MKHTLLSLTVASALALTLAGCGGKSTKTVKDKGKETGGKAPATATSGTATTPAITPASTTPVTASPATASPAVAPAPTPAAPAPAAPAKISDDGNKVMIAEHSLSYWMEALNSSTKDTVIEAISALSQPDARKFAHPAVAKLTELSKGGDKDIANDATEALKVIK